MIDGYQDLVVEQINATTDDGELWYRAHDPEQLFEIMLLSEDQQPSLVDDEDKGNLVRTSVLNWMWSCPNPTP